MQDIQRRSNNNTVKVFIASPDRQKLEEVISEALKTEGRSLLNFTQETEQWQNRVLSLRIWNPEQNWPDVSTETLLNSSKNWLAPYISQLRKADDFKKINLTDVLQHSLAYEQQILVAKLAPSTIAVPSGSNIQIKYSPYGEVPVLAVRLQELFGLLDTPKVNNGTKNVVIHLLSTG